MVKGSMDLAKKKLPSYVPVSAASGQSLTDNALHPGNPLASLNVLARTLLSTVHLHYPTSDLTSTTAIAISTVWEPSPYLSWIWPHSIASPLSSPAAVY